MNLIVGPLLHDTIQFCSNIAKRSLECVWTPIIEQCNNYWVLRTILNGSGQNGTDKMVWTKWYTDKMVLDKMVRTKWHGPKWYNFIFCVDFNSVEFNIYLVTKSHK